MSMLYSTVNSFLNGNVVITQSNYDSKTTQPLTNERVELTESYAQLSTFNRVSLGAA